MKKQSVYIKTFGCQMNERDSEAMLQLLAPQGFVAVATPEEADLVLINTCAVRDKAEQKVYSLLGQMRQIKSRRPHMLLGVVGCVAQLQGNRLFAKPGRPDLLVGPRQLHRLPEIVLNLQEGRSHTECALGVANRPDEAFPVPLPSPDSLASSAGGRRFVTIMQGCDNFCSYCVVPHTRGREISRAVDDILRECEAAVAMGAKEIILLGQNVNSYGLKNTVADIPMNFPGLLRKVAEIAGLCRLRFTTSHPKDLSEELMRCFAELPSLCPHLHLPVQSGSSAVLARMNRGYSRQDYLAKVALLRSYRPDIALGTDLIVGFPGESEEDFADTLALLEEVRFHTAFSFKYSDRNGTDSIVFTDKISNDVKRERLARLQQLQDRITLDRNREYEGQLLEVMVERCATEGMIQARAASNHLVHFPPAPALSLLPGDLVNVCIQRGGQHALIGEMESRGISLSPPPPTPRRGALLDSLRGSARDRAAAGGIDLNIQEKKEMGYD